jgi:hypothetical protein
MEWRTKNANKKKSKKVARIFDFKIERSKS